MNLSRPSNAQPETRAAAPAPDLSSLGSPSSTDSPSSTPADRGYLPALDGLRALAVAGVLLFHSRFSWARGGFLGVSTFFTLSGFLITRLLLSEGRATGTISLRRFYVRRLRRLMPAALCGVALAGVVTLAVGSPTRRSEFATDAVAAVNYVANWRFFLSADSYGALFNAPSTLLHYWSLSIEEQCYVVLPLLLLGLRRWIVGSPRRVALAVLGLVILLATVPQVLGFSSDRYYYGTDARAPELLIGALLACLATPQRLAAWGVGTRRLVLGILGVAIIGVGLLAWSTTTQSNSVLHHGGFLAHAVGTAILIASLAAGAGPVAWLLAWRPIVWIGKVSYGLYVYHWPLFQWLDEARMGLDGAELLAVRLAATFALTTVSFYVLEQPIRHRRGYARNFRPVWLGAPAVAAALTLAVVVTFGGVWSPPKAQDNAFANPTMGSGEERPDGLRVLLMGDSAATFLMPGLHEWERGASNVHSRSIAEVGCPLTPSARMRVFFNNGQPAVVPVRSQCDPFPALKRELATFAPQVVVIFYSMMETATRNVDGIKEPVALGDARYDQLALDRYTELSTVIQEAGASPLWLTVPGVEFGRNIPGFDVAGADVNDPARLRRFNALVDATVAKTGGHKVDLALWVARRWTDSEELERRPDGVHFTPAAAAEVVLGIVAPWIWKVAPADVKPLPGDAGVLPTTDPVPGGAYELGPGAAGNAPGSSVSAAGLSTAGGN